MPPLRRKRPKPKPLVGSQAFGEDPFSDDPMGAAAFGGADAERPIRGALLFGNDPQGGPRGAEALGGADTQHPLRGAILFGNAPDGGPTGSDAFGGADPKHPIRGALRVGNDPGGVPTGSDAFGLPNHQAEHRGSLAFGAGEGVPEKLYKDEIGYDFGATLLKADEGSMAGIRKDPRDALRLRVLSVLGRLLRFETERARHGLGEKSIKWGLLKDPSSGLDRELAEKLRRWYRRAPGEVLGIAHVRDVLEENERMHTAVLSCSWDRMPVTLSVTWGDEVIASAETRYHKEHVYFAFVDREGTLLGYADTLQAPLHRARVRGIGGEPLATLSLSFPATDEASGEGKAGHVRFTGKVVDQAGEPLFLLEEQVTSKDLVRVSFKHPASGDIVGRFEDRLVSGSVRAVLELDLSTPQVLAWALGAVLVDVARHRRSGFGVTTPSEEPPVESIREALGPPRRRG